MGALALDPDLVGTKAHFLPPPPPILPPLSLFFPTFSPSLPFLLFSFLEFLFLVSLLLLEDDKTKGQGGQEKQKDVERRKGRLEKDALQEKKTT